MPLIPAPASFFEFKANLDYIVVPRPYRETVSGQTINRKMKVELEEAEEMDQWIKSLPWKHKDGSLAS